MTKTRRATWLRRAKWLHAVMGVFVCLLWPGASYLDGSGRLAYTMFAEVDEYKIEITISTSDGNEVAMPPTSLAPFAGSSAAVFLAGAERFKPGPVHRTPREMLGPIAGLACAHPNTAVSAIRARVVLVQRNDARSPEQRFEAERRC
jgi:hypothetical protein